MGSRGLLASALLSLLFASGAAHAQGGERPKIGLALSGGGARGAAHIGVLKVLEREGIPVDYIAGTSFGALVGGYYALGYTADEIEKIFSSQDWNLLFSNEPERKRAPLIQRKTARYMREVTFRGFSPELPVGLWRGQKLTEIFNLHTTKGMLDADYDFDRLPIPFRAVATDLTTGKPYVFKSGRMTEALRASIALPFLFTPLEKEGMLLVDGGLSNNLPTNIVREMGAEVVIAVDVTSPLLNKDEIHSFLDVVDQSISLLMRQSVMSNIALADFVITPDLGAFGNTDYAETIQISRRGEEAAEKVKNRLKELSGGRSTRHTTADLSWPANAVVESVVIDGLQNVWAPQLLREVKSRTGRPLDLKTLGGDIAQLCATGMVDQADYELQRARDRHYRLTYLIKETPHNSLGASIRYDRDYQFVALAEYNARGVFGTPSIATLSSQFGGLENHVASFRYIQPKVPFLFLEPQIHASRLERLDIRDQQLIDRYTEHRIGGRLLLGASFYNRLEIKGGYLDERTTVSGGTPPFRQEGSNRVSGLTLQVDRDTADNQEFPSSGLLLHAELDKMSAALGGDFSYSRWQAKGQRFFALSQKTTLALRASGAFSHGNTPFYNRFHLGGYNFSDSGPQQLLGFDRDELIVRQAVILGGGIRRSVFTKPLSFVKKGYATVEYNLAGTSQRETSPYGLQWANGGGVGFLLDTLIGPIRLFGGWGQGGRFNLHLTIGPSF